MLVDTAMTLILVILEMMPMALAKHGNHLILPALYFYIVIGIR